MHARMKLRNRGHSRCPEYFQVSCGAYRFLGIYQTKRLKQVVKKVCPLFFKKNFRRRKTYKWRIFQVAVVQCTKCTSSRLYLRIYLGYSNIGWLTRPWKRRYKTCMGSESLQLFPPKNRGLRFLKYVMCNFCLKKCCKDICVQQHLPCYCRKINGFFVCTCAQKVMYTFFSRRAVASVPQKNTPCEGCASCLLLIYRVAQNSFARNFASSMQA